MSGRRAVFLDRDGVIDALVPDPESGRPESPLHPSDVALLPGVAAAMGRLSAAGYLLVGASNQPAAAKGTVPLAQLEAVQARILALLEADGARFDDFRICWHHPEGSDPLMGTACACRKPAPGMLLDAARRHGIDLAVSWMVGDSDADVLAGAAAGTRTVRVEHPASAHKRVGEGVPTLVADDLPAAVDAILRLASR